MGVLLAMVAAAAWGASSTFALLGLRSIRPVPGTFVSLLASLALLALATVIFYREALASVTPPVILWFALIGLISFPFARLLHFRSIELLGASRASALSAAAPLFAMLVALVFLQEIQTLNRPTNTLAAERCGGRDSCFLPHCPGYLLSLTHDPF